MPSDSANASGMTDPSANCSDRSVPANSTGSASQRQPSDQSPPQETKFSDVPASLGSRRHRKKPRTFEVAPSVFVRKPSTGSLGLTGSGVKLSSVPNIAHQLRKAQPKEPAIELLHRVLFNTQGSSSKRIFNIRRFSGFVFRSEPERMRAREKLLRTHSTVVRRIATILDVPVPPPRFASRASNTDVRSVSRVNDSLAPQTLSDDGSTSTSKNIRSSARDKTTPEASRKNGIAAHSPPSDAQASKSSAQKRDEQRAMKEAIVTAIMNFLEKPELLPGRQTLAQREKAKRAERKAVEQARKEKAARVEKEKENARLLEQQRKRKRQDLSSDSEDIDEDIETNALPWIEIARQMRQARGDTPTDGNGTRSSDASNSTV